MLLRNDDEQEIISRERKDRRDFEQLAQLADRMRLHRYFVALFRF
jgi:ATP-dependent RNA helicase DHX36